MLKKDIWRSLSVRCCKKIVLLSLISFISFSFGQISGEREDSIKSGKLIVISSVNRVLPPKESNVIRNNEIYILEIQSELSDVEIKELKNKKINDIMYVMEVILDENKRYLRVFITDPPKTKKNEKKTEEKVFFDHSLLDYQATNKDKNQDFVTMDIPYDFKDVAKKSVSVWLSIAGIVFALLLIGFGHKLGTIYLRKKRKRKVRKMRAKMLLSLWGKTIERRHFEEIYALRSEFIELMNLNEYEFKKLIQAINRYQYRKEWSDVDFKVLLELKNNMGELEFSGGV